MTRAFCTLWQHCQWCSDRRPGLGDATAGLDRARLGELELRAHQLAEELAGRDDEQFGGAPCRAGAKNTSRAGRLPEKSSRTWRATSPPASTGTGCNERADANVCIVMAIRPLSARG